MGQRSTCVLSAVLALGCAANDPVDSRAPAIIDGNVSSDRNVVCVSLYHDPNYWLGCCSGTLVTPRIVLTAAHCIAGAIGDDRYEIWFTDEQPETQIKVVKKWFDPRFDFDKIVLGHDIGLLLMEKPAPAGVTPVPLYRNRMTWQSVVGADVRFVGYGQTLEGSPDSWAKREASAKVTYVGEVDFGWEALDVPHTCYGDSGGPNLLQLGGVEAVAGVTSWGLTCHTDSNAQRVDIELPQLQAFIDANDPQAAVNCGADGVCGPKSCGAVDPDCPCAYDGFCTTKCADPELDPDCPRHCAADGLCVQGCPVKDPDCGDKATGAGCAGNKDCLSGKCVMDVCVEPCGAGGACPASLTCDSVSRLCLPGAGGGGCGVGGRPRGGWLALLALILLVRRKAARLGP